LYLVVTYVENSRSDHQIRPF